MNDKYVSPKEAKEKLQINTFTLIQWSNEGKIRSIRTKGGHRRYCISDIVPSNSIRRKICYARVSTTGQGQDLERQVDFLRSTYPAYELIKDVGSGINFKRKGLQRILEYARRGEVEEIVVTYKDRLCRFGFELIDFIVSKCSDGKIVVLNNEDTTPEQDLVTDLLSIITVFSSRLYGLRSYKFKKQVKETVEEHKIKR